MVTVLYVMSAFCFVLVRACSLFIFSVYNILFSLSGDRCLEFHCNITVLSIDGRKTKLLVYIISEHFDSIVVKCFCST